MMLYSYNRRAFLAAIKVQNPLVSLYASFVFLELALKAYQEGYHQRGHDICGMLRDFDRTTALAVQLQNGMRALHCRGRTGNVEPLPSDNYPALRYIRHKDDHPNEETTCDDNDLRNLQGIVDDIKIQLRKNKNIKVYL